MIKVLIVDDHKLVRKGIANILSETSGIHVVAEAGNGEEAIKLVRDLSPDVVLMDLQMPGMGGLEATRKLLRVFPTIKVLIITVYGSDVFPTKLLEEGVAGYITKDCSPDEMIRAIRAVHTGQRYLSSEIAQRLALKRYTDRTEGSSPFETLSERELQVMIMITSGKKPQEIARVLHLSPKTINTYRYRVLEKMGVKTDVELTHLALRHGIIDVEKK